MPVIESAKKALRSSLAKRDHNAEVKAELKRKLKNATTENLNEVVSFVDKAAKRNIIHPNKAARIKSALAKLGGEVTSTRAKKAAAGKTAKKSTAKKTTAKKK